VFAYEEYFSSVFIFPFACVRMRVSDCHRQLDWSLYALSTQSLVCVFFSPLTFHLFSLFAPCCVGRFELGWSVGLGVTSEWSLDTHLFFFPRCFLAGKSPDAMLRKQPKSSPGIGSHRMLRKQPKTQGSRKSRDHFSARPWHNSGARGSDSVALNG